MRIFYRKKHKINLKDEITDYTGIEKMRKIILGNRIEISKYV